MGDMGDDFRAMDADTKQRHADWHAKNREILDASGLPYTDKGETLLFRIPLRDWKADFYPSTGRWKDGSGKMHRGGAQRFLQWVDVMEGLP